MPERQKPQQQHILQDHAQDNEASTIANPERKEYENNRQSIFGRLLCRLGFHDDRVIDGTYGFGPGGNVQRVECKRCGRLETRWA
tara:strand:+ start:605 stop:859 length:255 start_codon:yes stop_codon:yes gene_type:complete